MAEAAASIRCSCLTCWCRGGAAPQLPACLCASRRLGGVPAVKNVTVRTLEADRAELRLEYFGTTDELHPLTEWIELPGEDRVTHAEAVESIRDAASITCGAEASDALKVSNR